MRRLLISAVACGALLVSACGTSASARLAKDLIPAPALESPAWGLRVASNGRALNPFGIQPSGAPLAPAIVSKAKTVASRQWVHGDGALRAGPLPESIFSVIDQATQFGSAAGANALVTALSGAYGSSSSQPVAGTPGATVLTAPFAADVPGGQVTGREELVVVERGAYVFTVLVVGGGSRPTAADAQALASLQAKAVPASLE
ncbi:MAG TPA: hypothetical protein VFA83_11880 [Acidimicrobiales bacterium]|nr:hypothetical protein [Acidimicrobiales bacterium]